MRRDSQRLLKRIQFLGSGTVLYIQTIVRIIVKYNSNKKPALVAPWLSIEHPKCCCLNSNIKKIQHNVQLCNDILKATGDTLMSHLTYSNTLSRSVPLFFSQVGASVIAAHK